MFKRDNSGNLIVISGPSGCGKSTICNMITSNDDNIIESISVTTRKIRDGEIEGVDYYFVSQDQFKEYISKDYFLEYAIYGDNYYGTPKQKVLDLLKSKKDVILVIEIEGALKIKELMNEAIFIFILPPSIKELKDRLLKRNTENKESLYKRFKKMYREINELKKYNYVVINDNLNDAVYKVKSIIESLKCRVDRIEDFNLDNLEEEIHEFLIELE